MNLDWGDWSATALCRLEGEKMQQTCGQTSKSPLAFKSLQRKLSTQTERLVEGVQSWADYRKQCSSVSFVIIRRPSSIPGDTRSLRLLKESHSPLQSRGAAVWHLERGCTSAAIIGSRQQVWTSFPKTKQSKTMWDSFKLPYEVVMRSQNVEV